MKKEIPILGAIMIAFFMMTSCGSKKNDYPSDVTQNFMNSCQVEADQKICSCLLDEIQKEYTYEEFSAIEVKMQAGQSPTDFLDFIGKARVACSK
jgi:hypothetical protein